MRAVPKPEFDTQGLSAQEKMQAELDFLRHKVVIQETTINYLSRQTQEDMLTGLLNRRGFERRLSETFKDYQRYGRMASLLMIDVNDFKRVNDTYGHLAGDAVLRHISMFLKKQTRDSDVVARLAGDEFCIILQEADKFSAENKAKQIMQEMQNEICDWAQQGINMRVSIGVCSYDEALDTAGVLDKADQAMYDMKKLTK